MKKLISALVLSLILTIGGIQNSKAALGLSTGGIAVTALGLSVSAYGTFGVAYYTIKEPNLKNAMTTALIGLFGILVLDEENQTVNFLDIDAKRKDERGLSEDERLAFNNEKEEISLLFNSISNEATSVEEAAELWSLEKNNLSKNAFNALVKMMK